MKVLINAASAQMGGAVTYLTNLTKWLARIAPRFQFIIYAPESTLLEMKSLVDISNVILMSYPFSNTGGIERVYFDQFLLRKLIRQYEIDVLFSTTGFGTLVCPCRQVLLVRNPTYFNREFQDKYREIGRDFRAKRTKRWLSLLSVLAADVVLFPTVAMREMVNNHISLAEKRTEVIHYGFDRDAFFAMNGKKPKISRQMNKWKQDGYTILLNVSAYAVHKNFETLIEALPLLIKQGIKIKLVTTISKEKTSDKVEYDHLEKRIRDLDLQNVVVKTGYIPYSQLSAVYQASDFFVFPSFTESFGHPMVEAMASGLPVVAADTAVNREVCGDAGIYFNTFDPVNLASAVAQLINNIALLNNNKLFASLRSESFDWNHYAHKLLSIF